MNTPFTIALSASVPLRIMELQARGGPDESDYRRAREASDIIGSQADVMLFRGGKPGQAADCFNATAFGLAVLAFCPGGVTFMGIRFCASHSPGGTQAGESRYCDMCGEETE